ncbi:MAG: MMPL family transporter [Candidatus Latescibacterota bacterium]|nr:MMPL family transporter [Candidatus Latescibacterota bacterium]
MEAAFHKLADVTYRRYKLILILAALLTVGGTHFVIKLVKRIETDIAALIPDNYRSVRTLKDIEKVVGGVGSWKLLVQSDDYEASKQFVEDLVVELKKDSYLDYVNFVSYQKEVEFYRKNGLLYMDIDDLEEILIRIEDRVAQEKVKLSPLSIDLSEGEESGELDFSDIQDKYTGGGASDAYFTDPEKTIVALEVEAAGTVSNIGFTKKMHQVMQAAVAKLGPEDYNPMMYVEYGGTYKNKIDEYDVIIQDVKSTLIYGVIGVVLILTIYFRQPLAAVFVAVPLVMGLIWSFALTYIVIGNLNTMTAFLFVILFGLGIDFGIHMFARYLEDRVAKQDVKAALDSMLIQTGQAVLTAALTTSMAFFSLMITDFKGFSEFGFIVGSGIVMSLVAMTTVLPAFLRLADEKLGLIRMKEVWGHQGMSAKKPFPFAKPILVVGVAVTFLLAINLHKIQFEYDFTNLRSNLPASVAVKKKIDKISPFNALSASPTIVLAKDKDELEQIVAAVQQKIEADTETPTIHTVRTLESFLPKEQDDKLDIIAEISDLANGDGAKLVTGEQKERLDELRELLEVEKLGVENLPKMILRKFQTIDGSRANFAFIYPDVQLRDGKNAMAFADDAQEIVTEEGKTYYSSSASIVFSDMLRLMLRDSPTAIGVTLLVVFLIVLADFKGLRPALLVMFPLVCGAVWMCGVMYLFGMKLNFYNMVALPTIIGMGIDNGVHLYHRYREEGPGSLTLVLRSTGGAMFVSMLTTMVGFLGLRMATHPGLNSIGVLALIGLFASFVTAVVVLPAILQVIESRRETVQDLAESREKISPGPASLDD